MKREDFEGATMYGDAWMRFVRDVDALAINTPIEKLKLMWYWYLQGWKAKREQTREFKR